jgi:drug/metabolite transporter (DMT)-like permease
MTWFWLALSAQLLFSCGTHIDKHLLSRYLHGAAPGSLIIFSSLFGFVVMPVAYAVDPHVLDIRLAHVLLLVGCGLLNITAIVLYLYALARDELVITGAVLVSVDLDARKFKGAVFALMAVASLFLALNAVVFKSVALEDSFWISTFWSYASLALAGVVLFSFVRPYREPFLRTLRKNSAAVIGLNAFNEIIAVVGYLLISYATLLAPVALVSVVAGFQPLMVFLLGWGLTTLVPGIARERLSRRQVVQKLVAMGLVLAGTFLLHAG